MQVIIKPHIIQHRRNKLPKKLYSKEAKNGGMAERLAEKRAHKD